MRVTRKCVASLEASTSRIIAGAPILRTVRLATSIIASWPVVCHFTSAWSCTSWSRLQWTGCGTARDCDRRTAGPSSTPPGPCVGSGARPSGMSTTSNCLPSAVKRRSVTSVASNGVRVTCVLRPVVTSATNAWDAVSKLAMKATCVPVGDHVSAETVAPAGTWIVRVSPERGSTRTSPVRVLTVSERDRLARVSSASPPR